MEHALWSGSTLDGFSATLPHIVGLSTLPIIETRARGGPCRMIFAVSAARGLRIPVSSIVLTVFDREALVRFIISMPSSPISGIYGTSSSVPFHVSDPYTPAE